MSVTLGGVDITGVVEVPTFDAPILSEMQQAVDGSIIIYQQEGLKPNIDLQGGADYGWLTLDILNQLKSMASVLESVYVLDYEGTERNVRFRTEDIPVIYADPIIPRNNVESTDWYNNVQIKLMEV